MYFREMKRFVIFSCILLSVFLSCKDKPKEPYIIPENAVRLLTADSVKSWKIARRYNGKTRMNMGDCFLGYRLRFRESGLLSDNNGLQRDCGPSLDATWGITTSEKGAYYLKFKSDQIPALLNQESDEKFFKILYISEDSLTLSYVHTQFNQRRRITDYMVREDVEVKDRKFHW